MAGLGRTIITPAGTETADRARSDLLVIYLILQNQKAGQEEVFIADSGDTRDSWLDSEREQPPQQREDTVTKDR